MVQETDSAQAGVIYGASSATEFEFAVMDPRVRRLDYVASATPEGTVVLCQVMRLKRESSLSFDQALAMTDTDDYEPDEKVSAKVAVIGFRDDRGLLQVPRVPFRAGAAVSWASEELIQQVIGLEPSGPGGAYLGLLKGTKLPVNLHINTLVQKHVSVLAKTGAGKSYCTGVLLEELMKQGVAIVIIDAHDEYYSLRSPNIESDDVDRLIGFGLKPKSFADSMDLWTTEMNYRTGTELLKLEGTAMQPGEISELLGGKLSGAQQGILYQAIKDARSKSPLYSLRDIIDQAHGNKSNSKWNVISALESLDSTGFFAENGIAPDKLVQSGRTSIVSLKGVAPDVQEVIVARLATLLFESRKSTEVPPFLLVVEEAHNYCPERGLGSAVSGGILRTVASEGRKFGMGLCVVSQRPAKIDKNVLSQCNTQIILKVTNPNDLKAIIGSVEGLTSDSADEIARLPVGVALVAGGSLGMPVLCEVRTRQSRHGGASVDIVTDEKKNKPVPRDPRAFRHSAQKTIDVPAADPPPSPAPASSGQPSIGTASTLAPGGVAATPESDETESHLPEFEVVDPSEPKSDREIAWGGNGKSASTEAPIVHEVTAAERRQARKEAKRAAKAAEAAPAASPAAAPIAARPPAAASAPEMSIPAEPRDVRVHRVANRVGYVATLKPEETLDLLRKAAARANKPMSAYIDPFAKVGRTHCHRDGPDCVNCPLGAKCAYKAKEDARAESSKERGVFGRFLGKR